MTERKRPIHQVDEALHTEAMRQLAGHIALENDQSWRATLRDRFAAWLSEIGDPMPVADQIDERCVAFTEAFLRIRGRLHERIPVRVCEQE